MQRAIDETDRRREKQLSHNKKHGITPRGVKKAVNEMLDGLYSGAPVSPKEYARIAEKSIEYAALTPSQMNSKIKALENEMYQHAEDLEFEEAAALRDEIQRVRNSIVGVGSSV